MSADLFFDYLNKIYFKNKIVNSDFVITGDMVYTVMINYCNPEENVEPFFNIWIDRFKTRPGIDVYRGEAWSHFCRFNNGDLDDNKAIKLYIPLKSHNLDSNVTRIFEFIRTCDMVHRSKVAKVIRNDNVVVRVENVEDALKIIDFVNSDVNIKKELNPVFPLTPSYHNVGISRDGIHSYNFELASVLADMLNKNIHLNLENYKNYLRQMVICTDEHDLKMIYQIGQMAFSSNSLSDITNVNVRFKRSNKALFDVMNATYDKYGEEQVICALVEYICYSRSGYFTRGHKYNLRTQLEQNFAPSDVLNIIESSTGKSNNIENCVRKFVNNFFADKISNEKEKNNKIVDDYLEYLKNIYLMFGYDKLVEIINLNYLGKVKYKDNVYSIYKKIIKSIYPNFDDKKIDIFIKSGYHVSIVANIVCSNIDKDKNIKV